MSIFIQMGYEPDASDDVRIALLKTLEFLNLQGIVASPFPEGTLALSSDDTRRAAIKINAAIVAGQGGGGGGSTGDAIATPASTTDFSGLPGGVAPAAGTEKIYWAVRDAGSYWTIGSGDTAWRIVSKDAP